MEKLSNCCIATRAFPPSFSCGFIYGPDQHCLFLHRPNPQQFHRRLSCLTIRLCSSQPTSPSPPATNPHLTQLSQSYDVESETLQILEWDKLCKQLHGFASTTMARSAALSGSILLGRSRKESQQLLDQTTAARALSSPLNFSGIEDVSAIVKSAVAGTLVTIAELCVVKRTLRAARKLREQLEAEYSGGDSPKRNYPLLEILQKCSFLEELEKHIEHCVDCNLSLVLGRASDKLATIRSERRRNMKALDFLLKNTAQQIFQAGGVDNPIVTKRRSRLCVGIRASHRSLLHDGLVLNVSGSGVTYFMEPKEAIKMNNKEVRLANSEKIEEHTILSFLTAEIAESAEEFKYLLDRIQEVDLAVARAGHAKWLNGVCPFYSKADRGLSVDVEGIIHPLLFESNLISAADEAKSNDSLDPQRKMDLADCRVVSDGFPVPIDIKIRNGARVVIISGPNAGGKTASMKTLGLVSLMSKAGLYLPARGSPELPWFDLVLADIGDHQSLEESLSTFSGHILRIRRILETVSNESLVLIDEIGSGTDPSEGVALSTSILQYLKTRVNLAVITTHYSELSCLKEVDARFENAAMEFCLETLRPTYKVLWGSTGESNALTIAKTIGFDRKIIERAENWVGRLVPEKQQKRRGVLYQSLLEERKRLYQSLLEERKRLAGEARQAASLHSDVMDLYHEIYHEAKDLRLREKTLLANDRRKAKEEIKNAKSQMDAIVSQFENRLASTDAKQFGSLKKNAESGIASIVRQHSQDVDLTEKKDEAPYTPQIGEMVHVKHLGGKVATVVEVSDDDGTILVMYGKVRVRMAKNSIQPMKKSGRPAKSIPPLKKQTRSPKISKDIGQKEEEASYGAMVQTSKNTIDLRGLRVEEASEILSMELLGRGSHSVLYIIHGMGSGALKEHVQEILKNHSRVVKFEQESSMNYGCTVAFIR